MQEDDNIRWEHMNLDGKARNYALSEEKDYNNLYWELDDKCNPKHFLDTTEFDSANSIYAELKKIVREYEFPDEIPEKSLIPIRNRAIHELDVRIQTKRKMDYLMQYFNPEIYMSMVPYPEERIKRANDYRKRVLQQSDDILALEAIEQEALEFISNRDEEVREQEKKKKHEELERLRKKKQEEEEQIKQDNKILAWIIGVGIVIMLFIIKIGS